jgi:hypothetical protein
VKSTRQAMESVNIDLSANWLAQTEAPGISIRTLSDDLDPEHRTGGRTRLVRFDPGAYVTRVLSHDFWEETFLLSGGIAIGCDAAGKGGAHTTAPAYSCRPPGTLHGVMASSDGCMLLEIQYYAR